MRRTIKFKGPTGFIKCVRELHDKVIPRIKFLNYKLKSGISSKEEREELKNLENKRIEIRESMQTNFPNDFQNYMKTISSARKETSKKSLQKQHRYYFGGK